MKAKKIDMFFDGDYVCSTNQSKTCREAVRKYLESAAECDHRFSGQTLIQKQILKNPKLLKARFDKDFRG